MRNLWFEHIIDAYLAACAAGRDWREACAETEAMHGTRPRTLLTQEGLRSKKGIPYSRQHLDRKRRAGAFPEPFNASPGYVPARKSNSALFHHYVASQLRRLDNKNAERRLRDSLAPHAFDGTEAHHAVNGALPGIENELVAAALQKFLVIKYRDTISVDAAIEVMLRLLETGELS